MRCVRRSTSPTFIDEMRAASNERAFQTVLPIECDSTRPGDLDSLMERYDPSLIFLAAGTASPSAFYVNPSEHVSNELLTARALARAEAR